MSEFIVFFFLLMLNHKLIKILLHNTFMSNAHPRTGSALSHRNIDFELSAINSLTVNLLKRISNLNSSPPFICGPVFTLSTSEHTVEQDSSLREREKEEKKITL